MITSKYDWQLASPSADEAFLALAKKAGLEASVATLLYERGIQTKEDLEDFLEPKLEKLHDPYFLHDMDKAVERIRRAIEDYEQILIYGDYDADGMTSASIMKETLEQMGAEVQVYLPNRFTDGYGPNESVYKYFIEQQDISLIVTVDNGVAGPGNGSGCHCDGPPLHARRLARCLCDHSSRASRCGLSLPLSSRMWCGL